MSQNLPSDQNRDIERRRRQIGELVKLKNVKRVPLEYWWMRKSLQSLERYIEAENRVIGLLTDRSRKINLLDNVDRLHALDLMEIEAQIAGFQADRDEALARSAKAKREIVTGEIDIETHGVLEKVKRDQALREDEVHILKNANKKAELTPEDELTPVQIAVKMAHDWEKGKEAMRDAGLRENDQAWQQAKEWYMDLQRHLSK